MSITHSGVGERCYSPAFCCDQSIRRNIQSDFTVLKSNKKWLSWMLPYVLCLVNTPPSTCCCKSAWKVFLRAFGEDKAKIRQYCLILCECTVLDFQCHRLCELARYWDPEDRTDSGSWNCSERLTLMWILHSAGGRLSLETSSLSPYPFHWNEPRLVETVNSTSPITSNSQDGQDSHQMTDFYWALVHDCYH